MNKRLLSWAGPVLGVVMITGVGTAFVGSAMAKNDSGESRERAEYRVDDTVGASGSYLSMDTIVERVKAQGYTDIDEVERERGKFEVKARNADGERFELYVDAKTGDILRREYED